MLSVKAVTVTSYSVSASRPDRVVCLLVMSPAADVSSNHSTRYMKDHMSGVSGASHNRSTLGGTGLATEKPSAGPGQTVGEIYTVFVYPCISCISLYILVYLSISLYISQSYYNSLCT